MRTAKTMAFNDSQMMTCRFIELPSVKYKTWILLHPNPIFLTHRAKSLEHKVLTSAEFVAARVTYNLTI